jgi:hypothetical protein
MRRLTAFAAVSALLVAGCGSSSTPIALPKIGAASTFSLTGFAPTAPAVPGKPVRVTFAVKLPDGKVLTHYKTGSGPHVGVHLIIVRDDLAYIIHHHPPVGPGGELNDTVTFPAPGPYRVLVDIYPDQAGVPANFQLHADVSVTGAYHPKPLPRFAATQTVHGYHFDMLGGTPTIHAIQATLLHVDVTSPDGKPTTFVPWFGALAHAVFFQAGSLNYFHTHICGPSTPNCASLAGVPTRVTGSSPAPGKLTVGVLLATPGHWELFLQALLGGKVVTVPYTLDVSS